VLLAAGTVRMLWEAAALTVCILVCVHGKGRSSHIRVNREYAGILSSRWPGCLRWRGLLKA
jgi:hypothetical protein